MVTGSGLAAVSWYVKLLFERLLNVSGYSVALFPGTFNARLAVVFCGP